MKRYLTPAWLIITGLMGVTLLYFIARVGEVTYRDAALANLFSTILGIAIGIPIALEINRRQTEQSSKRESLEREEANQLRTRALFHRLKEELTDNGRTLDRLRKAIDESSHSRQDHWEWLTAIAEGFRFDACADFASQQQHPAFPWDLEDDIRLSFSMLSGLQHRLREASASHGFYLGYIADTSKADKYLTYIQDLARETDRHVENGITNFSRHQSAYPRPQRSY